MPEEIDPVIEAVRTKIVSLAQQTPTPATLLAIEQTAKIGRQLVAAGTLTMNFEGPMTDPGTGPMATSPPLENFGGVAIREMVSMGVEFLRDYKKPKMTPSEIVLAIALARKEGMNDVAEDLKKQLVPNPVSKPVEES